MALAIWAGGFEVLPLVHLGLHSYWAVHSHGRHGHDHDEPHSPPPNPFSHGQHSLAHRDLAATSPLPVIAALPPVPFRPIRFTPASPTPRPTGWRHPARARGPPAA